MTSLQPPCNVQGRRDRAGHVRRAQTRHRVRYLFGCSRAERRHGNRCYPYFPDTERVRAPWAYVDDAARPVWASVADPDRRHMPVAEVLDPGSRPQGQRFACGRVRAGIKARAVRHRLSAQARSVNRRLAFLCPPRVGSNPAVARGPRCFGGPVPIMRPRVRAGRLSDFGVGHHRAACPKQAQGGPECDDAPTWDSCSSDCE